MESCLRDIDQDEMYALCKLNFLTKRRSVILKSFYTRESGKAFISDRPSSSSRIDM